MTCSERKTKVLNLRLYTLSQPNQQHSRIDIALRHCEAEFAIAKSGEAILMYQTRIVFGKSTSGITAWSASEKEVLVNHEIASFCPVYDR